MYLRNRSIFSHLLLSHYPVFALSHWAVTVQFWATFHFDARIYRNDWAPVPVLVLDPYTLESRLKSQLRDSVQHRQNIEMYDSHDSFHRPVKTHRHKSSLCRESSYASQDKFSALRVFTPMGVSHSNFYQTSITIF